MKISTTKLKETWHKWGRTALVLLCLVEALLIARLLFVRHQNYDRITGYIYTLNFILDREFGDFRFALASDYIDPSKFSVKFTAGEQGTPQEIFEFVSKSVAYKPAIPEWLLYDYRILEEGMQTNAIGEANLLCSLLRAHGFKSEECFVVLGSIVKKVRRAPHAWVTVHWKGKTVILDPTGVTEEREFGGWAEEDFLRAYKAIRVFEYNDLYKRFYLLRVGSIVPS